VKKEPIGTTFDVKTIDHGTARAAALRQPNAALGRVVENRILTKPGVPVKRHIGETHDEPISFRLLTVPAEFELPENSTARAGDYLAM
jgi:cytochrome P450 / NADPH-cytochrome P450 reductase